jgi:threonine dehydratase
MANLLSLDDIRAAARTITGHVERTPTVASPGMSALLGVPVALKLELLQRSGSFKPRGVTMKLLGLSPVERDAGVVAVSGDDRGIAVAEVANGMGVRATVVIAKPLRRGRSTAFALRAPSCGLPRTWPPRSRFRFERCRQEGRSVAR